ncbi:MAG: DUF2203 family protein [Acidobacteria bacterium]|nr:DUF2203 family protein [Acidobacteriota bacterium]
MIDKLAGNRVFTYAEALETFPQVRDETDRAVKRMEALMGTLPSPTDMEGRKAQLDREYRRIVEEWAGVVTGMGCEVKGLWLVDWDCGDGYYCWRYPEEALAHYHGYEEGFAGRVPIH